MAQHIVVGKHAGYEFSVRIDLVGDLQDEKAITSHLIALTHWACEFLKQDVYIEVCILKCENGSEPCHVEAWVCEWHHRAKVQCEKTKIFEAMRATIGGASSQVNDTKNKIRNRVKNLFPQK